MAQDRETFGIKVSNNGLVEHFGSFRPNAASAPTVVKGIAASVAHTATGVWTVTLPAWMKGTAFSVVGLFVAARFSALSGWVVEGGAIDLSAGTIIIRAGTWAGTTIAATDIASDAANWIDFRLVLKATKLPDGSGW